MKTVITRFNNEVIVSADTEQEAVNKLIEDYGFNVQQTNEEIVEFEGVKMLSSAKAEILANREELARLAQINDIKEQLKELDFRSIRALRAGETDRIAQYEAQAVTLRNQLVALGVSTALEE